MKLSRKFEHGKVRALDDIMVEDPRFKIGTLGYESYLFSEILKEYILLKMLASMASDICGEAANMLGKANTTDKIIHRYLNGLGGLVSDFEGFVYDVAGQYGLSFEGENLAVKKAEDIADDAIAKARAEAKKVLYIGRR